MGSTRMWRAPLPWAHTHYGFSFFSAENYRKTNGFNVCCVLPTHMLDCAQQSLTIKQQPDMTKQKRVRWSSHRLLSKSVTNWISTRNRTYVFICSGIIVNLRSPAPPNRHASKTLQIPLHQKQVLCVCPFVSQMRQHIEKHPANITNNAISILTIKSNTRMVCFS